MKLNLLIDGREPALNGYLNICQVAGPTDDQTKVYAELSNLDNLVDNNESEQVLVHDVLDFFPLSMRLQTLIHFTTKVAHKGEIVISGLNLPEVARHIFTGKLNDTLQANRVLYGNIVNVWTIRKSATPADDVAAMLLSTGQFDISAIRFNGLHYIVTGVRK